MTSAASVDDIAVAMDRYACGDDRAFNIVHRALYPRLSAFLLRLTGSPTLAADIVQETFLRMHRARGTFARGAAVLPWAYAIARNAHHDHARAARLRRTERLPSDPGHEPVAGDDVESAAAAHEAARRVERVLATLPPAQREAFVLIRYEGLSVAEAAAVLGATPTAVKLRAFRAYETLRAELADLRAPQPRAETSFETPDEERSAPAAPRRAGPRKGRTDVRP